MGSLNPVNEVNLELDDSGYVQEDGAAKEVPAAEGNKDSVTLLDLSDDVLLYILQYCSPIDLKALGFCCSRLGALILDRTLWQRVDARGAPTGKHRMRWLLTHGLSAHTTSLKLSGYARETAGCLGFMTGSSEDSTSQPTIAMTSTEEVHPWNMWNRETIESDLPGPRLLRLCAEALPRYGGGFPYWPEDLNSESPPSQEEAMDNSCPGPQVTLTHAALCRLKTLCSKLSELCLDHVVIDCNMTKICMFPQTLRVLSLVGTKCFNVEKSFLYKIQDYLINLEDLDVSECEWVEPACMLPLSKLPQLRRLSMRLCPKLTEFVAYASLATRYGFKQLRVLDMRGSPVGDSEVSALGWVPLLEELYLSPAPPAPNPAAHAHFSRDPPPAHREHHPWEDEEPEYYKSKYETEAWIEEERSRPTRNRAENATGACVVLQHVGTLGVGPAGEVQRPTPSGSAERAARDRAETTLKRMGYNIIRTNFRHTVSMYPETVSRNGGVSGEVGGEKTAEESGEGSGQSVEISQSSADRQESVVEVEGSEEGSGKGNDQDSGEGTTNRDSGNGNQDKEDSRKRKQNDEDGPTKHFKAIRVGNEPSNESNSEASSVVESTQWSNAPDAISKVSSNSNNEACSSNPSSTVPGLNSSRNNPSSMMNEPNEASSCEPNNSIEPSTSTHEPQSSYQHSPSGFSSEVPSSSRSLRDLLFSDERTARDVPTKASRKHFDARLCQVTRAALRDSLEDFRRRTEAVPECSTQSFDTDYEPALGDDEEYDDTPQPKRCRLNDGATTSGDRVTGSNELSDTSKEENTQRCNIQRERLTSHADPSSSTSSDQNQSSEPSTSSDQNQSSQLLTSIDQNQSSHPSTSSDENHFSLPSTSKDQSHTSRPSTSKDQNQSSQPSSSKDQNHSSRPSTSKDQNQLCQPSPSKEPNQSYQLSTSKDQNQSSQPSTSKKNQSCQPSTSEDHNQSSQLSTSKDENQLCQPSTSKDQNQSNQPSSSKDPNQSCQPSTSNDRNLSNQPSTSKDENQSCQPSTSKDQNQSCQPSISRSHGLMGGANITSSQERRPMTLRELINAPRSDTRPENRDHQNQHRLIRLRSGCPPAFMECPRAQARRAGSRDPLPPAVAGGCYSPHVIENDHGAREGSNEPPVVVGCGHNPTPGRLGCGAHRPAVVVERCGHRDYRNVHNNNDAQQPDWNTRRNAQGINPDGGSNRARREYPPSIEVLEGSSAEAAFAASAAVAAGANAYIVEGTVDRLELDDFARHRILYVNVGRRRHAMYQVSVPEPVDLRTERPLTAAMHLIYSSHVAPRLEYTSLVTDAALRRFGRADGDNINYVHMGPHGPVPAPYDDPHARPNRSNLRVLSVTGYRNISNVSLNHLATAAPHLQMVDFTGTRVTESGVQHFRNLRPECRVRYGPADKPRDDNDRPHSR